MRRKGREGKGREGKERKGKKRKEKKRKEKKRKEKKRKKKKILSIPVKSSVEADKEENPSTQKSTRSSRL